MSVPERLLAQPDGVLFAREHRERVARRCINNRKFDRVGSNVYGGEFQLAAVFSSFS